MKSIHPDYAVLVKEVRRQLAISQEDLARELGVSYATVNRWENGQARPSRLARAQLETFKAAEIPNEVNSEIIAILRGAGAPL